MNSNSRCIRLYVALMLLITAVAVSFRTYACLTVLEYSWGYFSNGIPAAVGSAFIAACTVFCITYIFFAERISIRPSFSSPANYVPTALIATALAFVAISLISSFNETAKSPMSPIISAAAIVFAFLSIVHFFLNAHLTEAVTELRGYFSLCTVLFLALYASFLYFDPTLPINSPNKLVDQLAFLFSALFFLYEARISLGRERWRPYVAFGLLASAFTAYSSIPSLIVYFAKGRMISYSIEESTLTFTLFIFIVTRLLLTASLRQVRESSFVSAMRSYAERRSEIVAESIKVHKEAFATQMTIDDLIPTGDDTAYLIPEDGKDNEGSEEEYREEDDEMQEDIFSIQDITEELTPTDSDETEARSEEDNEKNTGN